MGYIEIVYVNFHARTTPVEEFWYPFVFVDLKRDEKSWGNECRKNLPNSWEYPDMS